MKTDAEKFPKLEKYHYCNIAYFKDNGNELHLAEHKTILAERLYFLATWIHSMRCIFLDESTINSCVFP